MAAAAAGEGGGRGSADSSSSSKDKLPVLMGYTISVEDAAEPASNSPTGFNCRAQLRVYPVAATAAAAAAAAAGSTGSTGSSAGDSWLRVLGCSSEPEGLAVLENLSVAVGSEAGPCAAEAHVVVEDRELVVVADSGVCVRGWGGLGCETCVDTGIRPVALHRPSQHIGDNLVLLLCRAQYLKTTPGTVVQV